MDGKGDGLDAAAVGLGIVNGATVDFARTALAKVGEVEAAMRIEDDVVGALERKAGARGVQRLDCAGRQIDALDAAARIVVGLPGGDQTYLRQFMPVEAAVVANVDFAVRSDRRAVGSAGVLRNRRLGTVGRDARQPRRLDLHDQHRAVGQGHRPLRKAQAARDLT